MNNEFGLKELYDLTLKATYPMEIEGRSFERGEVIARFDKIQLANFSEITSRVAAKGGYLNEPLVFWEDPKEIQLKFTQGIFSRTQLALLSNSNLIKSNSGEKIIVPGHYLGESDDNGKIYLPKKEVFNVFVYETLTSKKITPEDIDSKNGVITISQLYGDVEVNFDFSVLRVGDRLIQGYLLLEGKTRVKDDITGKTRTAILRIPRLKLVSDLSMRLGREAGPVLASFSAIGLPTGERGSKRVMEMYFLNDDEDADI